jgi:hypothetical protein
MALGLRRLAAYTSRLSMVLRSASANRSTQVNKRLCANAFCPPRETVPCHSVNITAFFFLKTCFQYLLVE